MQTDEPNEMDGAPDSQIGHLLKLSGRRRMPQEAQVSRARAAAHAEWQRAIRVHRWRAWRPAASGAIAVALVAIGAGLWSRSRPPAPAIRVEIATLRTVTGVITVTRDGQDRAVREPGLRVLIGDRISTDGASRAALVLADGLSLRLDRDSAATIDAGRVTLVRGGAYVDAGRESRRSGLAVETPLGIVRHVGTQFEVRRLDESLRVRVREGTVVVERQAERWTTGAGEEFSIAAGRAPERRPAVTSGPEWNWASDLATPLDLEGTTLKSFLEWAGRELGWRWEFDSPATRRRAEPIVLRGSVEGLTPGEAVAAILPTCGLVARREGDRLILSDTRQR